MKLYELDISADGSAPVAECLVWLDQLLHSPSVPWSPEQRHGCATALVRAHARMQAEVFVAVAQDGALKPALLDQAPPGLHN